MIKTLDYTYEKEIC